MFKNGYINIHAISNEELTIETKLLLSYCKPYYNAIVIKIRDPIVYRSTIFPFSMDDGIMGRFPSWKPPMIDGIPAMWKIVEDLGYDGGSRNIWHHHQINWDSSLTKGAYKLENNIWLKKTLCSQNTALTHS